MLSSYRCDARMLLMQCKSKQDRPMATGNITGAADTGITSISSSSQCLRHEGRARRREVSRPELKAANRNPPWAAH